jgi:hypothetical protein
MDLPGSGVAVELADGAGPDADAMQVTNVPRTASHPLRMVVHCPSMTPASMSRDALARKSRRGAGFFAMRGGGAVSASWR